MANLWFPFAEQLLYGIAFVLALGGLFLLAAFIKWGSLWLQAFMSGADVSMRSLIIMSLMRIDHRLIITAKVMARQAGLPIDREEGMSTDRLLAFHLAGGDVKKVVQAIIAAQRAGIELKFDRAAAIDLAGRDVLLAVQTTVSPKVIPCPPLESGTKTSLSAIARNGVELLVGVKVTVRTNLNQLIGGATEETIVARIGQDIISAIGSAESHMDVLEVPSRISKRAMENGLDSNTAFSIVSVDIADIDVGENIGARLQTEQASADTLIAQALAEARRADAVALEQEMRAKVTEAQANLILAEAQIPLQLAKALRSGQFRGKDKVSTSDKKSSNSRQSNGRFEKFIRIPIPGDDEMPEIPFSKR